MDEKTQTEWMEKMNKAGTRPSEWRKENQRSRCGNRWNHKNRTPHGPSGGTREQMDEKYSFLILGTNIQAYIPH
jgi:hypothetical protein